LLLLFCVWRRDVPAVGRNDNGGWFAVLVVACYFAKCLRYNARAATCESGESSPHSKGQAPAEAFSGWPFAIWPLAFLAFDIWHWALGICHLAFGISGIHWHSLGIHWALRHWAFDI
jgi:hypothetical protein